jgi:hypothetical protein
MLSCGVYSYDSVLSRFEHDKPHHSTDSNRLHHYKSCSNHNIEPHHNHLTSRQIKDQHSQHSAQVKLNIIKMERLVRRLKTAGLSITTKHKNSTVKYERLGNQLTCSLCILERENILEQNGQGLLALLPRWLLLKVLEVKFLKILKVVGAE